MSQTTNLGNMFKLFSIAFTPITAKTVNIIVSGMLADDMAQAWSALELPGKAAERFCSALEEYKSCSEEKVLHELRTDWAHMFMGESPQVTNTEGLWRYRSEGREAVRMINHHTKEVADFMRNCGVTRQEKYNDCIDYLENECDFCAFLANGPEYLVEMGKDNMDLLEDFMHDHMLLWAPGFCEDIQRESQSTYYRALATLMGEFLKEF